MSEPTAPYGDTAVREMNAEAWEEVIDALDHIARVCRGSRTSSRRIRWIEQRAQCAIDGSRDWRELDLPKMDPRVSRLEDLIRTIRPHVAHYRFSIENDVADQLDQFLSKTAYLEEDDDVTEPSQMD